MADLASASQEVPQRLRKECRVQVLRDNKADKDGDSYFVAKLLGRVASRQPGGLPTPPTASARQDFCDINRL
jgi:hypothetical protein